MSHPRAHTIAPVTIDSRNYLIPMDIPVIIRDKQFLYVKLRQAGRLPPSARKCPVPAPGGLRRCLSASGRNPANPPKLPRPRHVLCARSTDLAPARVTSRPGRPSCPPRPGCPSRTDEERPEEYGDAHGPATARDRRTGSGAAATSGSRQPVGRGRRTRGPSGRTVLQLARGWCVSARPRRLPASLQAQPGPHDAITERSGFGLPRQAGAETGTQSGTWPEAPDAEPAPGLRPGMGNGLLPGRLVAAAGQDPLHRGARAWRRSRNRNRGAGAPVRQEQPCT